MNELWVLKLRCSIKKHVKHYLNKQGIHYSLRINSLRTEKALNKALYLKIGDFSFGHYKIT